MHKNNKNPLEGYMKMTYFHIMFSENSIYMDYLLIPWGHSMQQIYLLTNLFGGGGYQV